MKNLVLIALSTFALSAAVSAHAWEPDVYVGGNIASMNYKHSATRGTMNFQMIEAIAGIKLIEYLAIEARVGTALNTARDSYWAWEETNVQATDDEGTPLEDEFGNPIWLTDRADYSQEAEMSVFGSVYLKPMISNETATLYGLIGYSTVEIEHRITRTFQDDTGTGYLFDDTEGDLAYGIGASFKLWKNAELTAEWRKLINAEDFDIRGGSLGFTYTF